MGRSADEIIGKTIWDIFEKDEADKRFAIVREVFARNVPMNSTETSDGMPNGGVTGTSESRAKPLTPG